MGVRRARDEEGAYLVLYALLAVVLFSLAALVLDIAGLRQGRRIDRNAADLAVTAGMVELDVGDPASFAAACRAAWGYVLANRAEAPGAASPPDCDATFPPTTPCSALLGPRTASGSVGPLTVEITHPVSDNSPLMEAEAAGGDIAQGVDATRDGVPCERLAVRVVRSRQLLFGGLLGTPGGTTDVHSVARARTVSTSEVPAVVAVERTGCDALTSSAGGGQLFIRAVAQPGVAVVDSDASTCGGGYVIAPGNPSRIEAVGIAGSPGVISSFALAGPNFGRAYDPAAASGNRLVPTPTPTLVRTGRGIIDNRYNCVLSTCPAAATAVDQLEAALQGPGVPSGYTVYPPSPAVPPPADPCTLGPTDPPLVLVGNTFVNCPVFVVGNSVTFGTGTVFAGDVLVQDGGCLAFNDIACGGIAVLPLQDGVVFLRGGLTKAPKSRLVLARSFVYSTGAVSMPQDPDPSPDSSLSWTAPVAGNFDDLLLWTEAPGTVRLGEQDNILLEGTLFAPNATLQLEVRDSGPGFEVAAQVVAGRVRLVGGTDLTLRPTAGRATSRLTRQTRLIR